MNLGHITLEEAMRAQCNTLVLGSIGFGKSKFLEYLMRQDLAARQPFCLIDLHGTLFEKVRAWCAFNAYDDRRIIVVDPSSGTSLKGFNPFRRKQGLDIGVQSSAMVEAVLRVWGLENPDSYPVIYKLTKVLFTLMIEKDVALHEGFRLFADRAAFSNLVSQLSDPLIKALWSDLSNLSQSEWSRAVTPTVNKLFRIVQSKTIQRFMCLTGDDYNLELNFRDTILVNLATSGSLDSDAAKTFAALLLNDLYQSAKRRKASVGRDPRPYYVYVDEWWLVPTPDVARILAETRKFGLLLVLANQDLSQISVTFGAGFAHSILTLCQVQCCFGGINHTDASRLSKEWGMAPSVVQSLAQRECLLKLPRRPVSLIAVPDVKEPFLVDEKVEQFGQRIAERTGALTPEQVDVMLAKPQENNLPARQLTDDDFLL
jgi:type IV secretory system conjugative DNA transfer VirD4/TraG family protein